MGHQEKVNEEKLAPLDQRSVSHVCMYMNTHMWNELHENLKTQFVNNSVHPCG